MSKGWLLRDVEFEDAPELHGERVRVTLERTVGASEGVLTSRIGDLFTLSLDAVEESECAS